MRFSLPLLASTFGLWALSHTADGQSQKHAIALKEPYSDAELRLQQFAYGFLAPADSLNHGQDRTEILQNHVNFAGLIDSLNHFALDSSQYIKMKKDIGGGSYNRVISRSGIFISYFVPGSGSSSFNFSYDKDDLLKRFPSKINVNHLRLLSDGQTASENVEYILNSAANTSVAEANYYVDERIVDYKQDKDVFKSITHKTDYDESGNVQKVDITIEKPDGKRLEMNSLDGVGDSFMGPTNRSPEAVKEFIETAGKIFGNKLATYGADDAMLNCARLLNL